MIPNRCMLLLACLFQYSTLLHAQDSIWVDKFDKANETTLLGGDWYTFTDEAEGGASKINFNYSITPERKNQGIQFSYSLQKDKCKWNPYTAIACSLSVKQTPLDSVQAVVYEYKGAAHSFHYRTSSVKDYGYFQKAIPASENWTTVLIPLFDLSQPGWSKKTIFNEQEVHSLAWLVSNKTNDSGTVFIDNLQLVRSINESSLTPEQIQLRKATREKKAKLDKFIHELLGEINDSLVKNLGADGIQLTQYKQAIQKTIRCKASVDSLQQIAKKTLAEENDRKAFTNLLLLIHNPISGDVYPQVRALNSERILRFNKLVPLTYLYQLEKEYLIQYRKAEEVKHWVAGLFAFSSTDEVDYLNSSHPDSVFQQELNLYAFKKGEVIAELGTGSGYFEQAISKYTDNLTVYVNEIDSAMVSALKTKLTFLEWQDKKNIRYIAVKGDTISTGLPENKFDKIIIKNAFHHFSQADKMLDDIKRILKKKGKLFIVETYREKEKIPFCGLLITREQLLDSITKNGFLLQKETKLPYGDYKCLEFVVK